MCTCRREAELRLGGTGTGSGCWPTKARHANSTHYPRCPTQPLRPHLHALVALLRCGDHGKGLTQHAAKAVPAGPGRGGAGTWRAVGTAPVTLRVPPNWAVVGHWWRAGGAACTTCDRRGAKRGGGGGVGGWGGSLQYDCPLVPYDVQLHPPRAQQLRRLSCTARTDGAGRGSPAAGIGQQAGPKAPYTPSRQGRRAGAPTRARAACNLLVLPKRKHERALRLPALVQQRRGRLQQRDHRHLDVLGLVQGGGRGAVARTSVARCIAGRRAHTRHG